MLYLLRLLCIVIAVSIGIHEHGKDRHSQDQRAEDVNNRSGSYQREKGDIFEPNDFFTISVMTRRRVIAGRAYVVWVLVRKKR